MVVPDRIVQAEGLVAIAPAVAGARVPLDHDRRHLELAKAGAERDAALAAADDEAVGLGRVAELGRLRLARFPPRLPVPARAVLGAHRAARPVGFLVPLQLLQRGQEGPDPPFLESHVSVAASDAGLELDPGLDQAVAARRELVRVDAEAARFDRGQLRLEQFAHAALTLDGLDVPGERDQVAPEAVGAEELDGGVDVAALERVGQSRQGLLGEGLMGLVEHGRSPASGERPTIGPCPDTVNGTSVPRSGTCLAYSIRSMRPARVPSAERARTNVAEAGAPGPHGVKRVPSVEYSSGSPG